MYKRSLAPVVQRFSELYPVVGIVGPRQSGKTTLARMLFPDKPYVSLENLDTRLLAQRDTRGFLEQYKEGAIFDEVQHVPELLSYLQQVVDDAPQKGRFVITGSQNFALSESISQTLSGRVGMTTLLPLTFGELGVTRLSDDDIFKGGYPRLYTASMLPTEFFPSYIQTYIERDVRQIRTIENLGKFQSFLKVCAGRVGQLVNMASLAQDCGISPTTAKQWLAILEASYVIFFLQPFYKNFTKRFSKMPKLYFYDTGLACSLLGLEKAAQLQTHYLKGALYENAVLLELFKSRCNKALPANLYFWRDQAGKEVDVVAEWGGSIKALEIKSSSTFAPDFIKNVHYFAERCRESFPHEKVMTYVVYGGQQGGSFSETTLVPFHDLDRELLGE